MITTSAFKFLIAPQDGLLASEDDIPDIDEFYWLAAVDGSEYSAERQIAKRKIGEGTRMNDGLSAVSGMGSSGTIEAVVQDEMIGLLLWAALGTDVVTNGSDPYTHTITPAQLGNLPYFTIIKQVGELWEAYPNCKINELVIRATSEGDSHIMTAAISAMGVGVVRYMDEPVINTSAPEISLEEGFYTWNMGLGTWEVDGDDVACISEFSITIRENLFRVAGEGLAGCALAEGALEVEANSTVTVADISRYLNAVYGTETPSDGDEAQPIIPTGSFGVTFTRVSSGGSAKERSFEISIPELRYEAEVPRIEGDTEGRPLEVAMAGIAVGADPKATFIIKNGVVEYYTETSAP